MFPKPRNRVHLIRFRKKGSRVVYLGLEHFLKVVLGCRGFKELFVKKLLGLLEGKNLAKNYGQKEANWVYSWSLNE